MAYVSKEKKALIKAALDEALAGTGVKATLAVRHHSTIVCTLRRGPVDFVKNHKDTMFHNWGEDVSGYIKAGYMDINTYHYDKHFRDDTLELVDRIVQALNVGNYDNSDRQSDYFDVGHYVDLNVGAYDKPYELLA